MNTQELKIENIVNKVLGEKASKLNLISIDNGEAVGNFSLITDLSEHIRRNSFDIRTTIGSIAPVIIESDDELLRGYGLPALKILGDCNTLWEGLPLSGDGFSSYTNLVGVNTAYAKKCIAAKKNELLLNNLHSWHQSINQDKSILVRGCHNQANALLSDRYTIFDNHEVLDAVYGVLGPLGEYSVKNYSVTPSMMNLRVVSRDKININGDELSFGFDIRNSNIGKSSVEIAIIIYRWICSNGLIVGGGKGYMMRQRHVAVDRESLVREFVTLLDSSPDVITHIKGSIEKSMDTKLNSNEMQKIIDSLKANGMIKNAIGRLEEYTEPAYDGTLWGVVNGITRLSQDYSLDTRLRMEKIAGEILGKYSA